MSYTKPDGRQVKASLMTMEHLAFGKVLSREMKSQIRQRVCVQGEVPTRRPGLQPSVAYTKVSRMLLSRCYQ